MNLKSTWPICWVNFVAFRAQGIAKYLFITVVLLLILSYTQAQDSKKYPEVNILSPNAASLGKYVDFPVNMHTGVPEISIPIYTVKEGSLELPISLSYHAGGLKVQETASWVGAGWSLNAGGVISRTVKGLPDEEVGYDNFSFLRDFGYSNYFTTTMGMSPEEKTDYDALSKGHKDGEPDIFFFNFAGYSGKFYFREDRTPMLIPEGDLKIEPYFKADQWAFDTYDYLAGFTITVPDGTKYYFGVTTNKTTDVDPVEKSGYIRSVQAEIPASPEGGTFCQTQFRWGTDKVFSSWYLYQIESPDGKSKIRLSYRSESYAYHMMEAAPDVNTCWNINMVKSQLTGVALDSVIFSNGFVKFVPSSAPREDLCKNEGDMIENPNVNAKSLSEIRIQSTATGFCTAFKLNQGYFTNNDPLPNMIAGYGERTADKKRLKLNSVQEFSCDNSTSKPPYVFTYYDETSVPRRLSFAQDHWGYNNGAITNDDLMPTLWTESGSAYTMTFNDNREAQWPQMRAGTLRSIQYPTGGGTEFVYEPNTVKTSKCVFAHDETTIFSVSAGMGTAAAEYGTPAVRTLTTSTVYFYRLYSSGNGSGTLYVDNTPVASVSAGQTQEGYLPLGAGTYTIKAYANSDTGSGNGVYVYFYSSIPTCADDSKLVGGLRIKRIEQFGISGAPRLVKSYEYDQANLYSVPVYFFKLKNELLRTGILPTQSADGGCKVEPGGWVRIYTSPVSVQPMQTSQGYHIGYGKVKEILPDGGYTINEFKGLVTLPGGWQSLEDVCVRTIRAEACAVTDPVYPFPPLPYDFGRGNLKSKQVYDKFNNKLAETTYTEEYQENLSGVFGVMTAGDPESDLVIPTHYQIKTARILWQKETNKVFKPGSTTEYLQTESTTEYNSQYHRLPTKVIQTINDGTQEQRMIYAPDLTQCSNRVCSSCSAAYNSQLQALRDNFELNLTRCRLGLSTDTDCSQLMGYDHHYWFPCADEYYDPTHIGCQVASWTDYQWRLNELRESYTTCIKNCTATSSSCITNGTGAVNPSMSTVYKMESKNQIASPIESSTFQGTNLIQSTFFDYQVITSSPLDINLKQVFLTEISQPTNIFSPASFSGGALVKDAKYSTTTEVSYEYDQGRIVEMTGRNGVKTSYLWGYTNAFPIVKAVGVDYNSLKTAYNANPSAVRSHPLMANAMITTYQYDPVIGMVSVTDTNNRIQTYNYDLLGRLLRIKDNDGKVVEQYEYKFFN